MTGFRPGSGGTGRFSQLRRGDLRVGANFEPGSPRPSREVVVAAHFAGESLGGGNPRPVPRPPNGRPKGAPSRLGVTPKAGRRDSRRINSARRSAASAIAALSSSLNSGRVYLSDVSGGNFPSWNNSAVCSSDSSPRYPAALPRAMISPSSVAFVREIKTMPAVKIQTLGFGRDE